MDREELKNFIKEEFGVTSEKLWADKPEFEVFRHPCGKWFGVVMSIDGEKVKMHKGEIEVLKVKCEPMLVDILVQQKGYLRAYHMNKRLWLTVVLDMVDFDSVKSLIADSYALVAPRTKKK